MAKKRRFHRSEPYAGRDERRRMEYEDSKMISEDHNAIANLPQDVKMMLYPRNYYGGEEGNLDDTLWGIDRQQRDDVHSRDIKRGNDPEKY